MSQQPPTWRLSIRLARSNTPLSAAHLALWTVHNQTPLLWGLLAAWFFDVLLDQRTFPGGTNMIIAALIGVGLLQIMLVFAAGHAETVMRFVMAGMLRRNLLDHLLRRPGAEPLPFSIGDLISRFRDDAHEVEDSLDWAVDIVGAGLCSLFVLAILLTVDARITLIVFAPVLGVTLITMRASEALGRRRAVSSQATSTVTGAIGDILSAVQTLQAAGAEGRVVDHFRQLSERRRTSILADRVLTQVIGAMTTNTVAIGTGVIMLLAAGRLRDGSMSVGQFVLFVTYLVYVADFTDTFGKFLAHYQQATVSWRRLSTLLPGDATRALVAHNSLHLRGELPAVPPPQPIGEPLQQLTARGLTYHYPDGQHGISGINLELPRGSLTVVTGRVGAGKTTLLRALLGLLPLEAGALRWNGVTVEQPTTFFVPPRAAYTPQTPRLFSDTLRANILLGRPDDEEALADAIYDAVFEDDLRQLDAGLDTSVGSRGVKLSGGQVQRAAAARMLIRQPELLVIDDLSSALDVATEQLLWQRLLESGERTILAVSHRRPLLRRADQIVVLEAGRVVAVGRLAELLATTPALRAIWDEEE